MTPVLAIAVVVAQLLDVVTWLAMPRAAEVNPIALGLHSGTAFVLKGLLVVLVLGIQPALRPRYRAIGELVAVVAIAAGCIGAGSNLAVLTYVAAAEAPRPVPEPAPIAPEATGIEQGDVAPAAPERTPASRVRSTERPLRGRASWYAAAGAVAAAGPALRRRLGRHWRGTWVGVCAWRCIRVSLVDWCLCRVHGSERLIDLSDDAFGQLAPLHRGLIQVRIVVPRGTTR